MRFIAFILLLLYGSSLFSSGSLSLYWLSHFTLTFMLVVCGFLFSSLFFCRPHCTHSTDYCCTNSRNRETKKFHENQKTKNVYYRHFSQTAARRRYVRSHLRTKGRKKGENVVKAGGGGWLLGGKFLHREVIFPLTIIFACFFFLQLT